MPERLRMYTLAIAFVALGQAVPFFHAGDDILRSKSLDRDSYNSGLCTIHLPVNAQPPGNRDDSPIARPISPQPLVFCSCCCFTLWLAGLFVGWVIWGWMSMFWVNACMEVKGLTFLPICLADWRPRLSSECLMKMMKFRRLVQSPGLVHVE